MPISMRRQTIKHKKSIQKRTIRCQNRTEALTLLKSRGGKGKTTKKSLSNRDIATMAGVPRTVVNELCMLLQDNNYGIINKLISPDTKAGRTTVLSPEEERIEVQRLKFVASRGAAVGYCSLRYMMAKIAADGRKGYKNGIPSDEALRSFRSRHRDLTFRAQENKERAKLHAESVSHVQPFFDIINNVGRKTPEMLNNPNRIWNVDETDVDATYGKREKVFTCSKSNHGGFVACSTNKASQKHITAVICVSASGLKTPPFFIVAGKRINERWFDAVKGSPNDQISGVCARYAVPGWFPDEEGVIKVTENGSMEMGILQAFITHISKHFQKIVGSQSVLLTLDGHASRNGTGWIEECRRNNIDAVIAPANTSHFLQPCDQAVNKRCNTAMRELRDAYVMQSNIDTRKVNFNLACAVHAHEQITTREITKSFAETGLYPFQMNFAQRFHRNIDGLRNGARCKSDALLKAGVASRLGSVMKRRSDTETFAKLREAFSKSCDPSVAIQTMYCILKNAETVNSIFLSAQNNRSSLAAASTNLPMVLHAAGAAAECVTLRETLKKKAAEEEMKRRQAAEKAQQKCLAQEEKKAKKQREKAAKRLRQQEKAAQNKRAKLVSEKRAASDKKLIARLTRAVSGTVRQSVFLETAARHNGGSRAKKRSVRAIRFAAGLVVELLMKAIKRNG